MSCEDSRCVVRLAGRRYGSACRHVVHAAVPAPRRHAQAEPDAGQERVPGNAVRERGAPIAHHQHQRRGRKRCVRLPMLYKAYSWNDNVLVTIAIVVANVQTYLDQFVKANHLNIFSYFLSRQTMKRCLNY